MDELSSLELSEMLARREQTFSSLAFLLIAHFLSRFFYSRTAQRWFMLIWSHGS
jgi:hypothetical protein